MNTDTTRSDDDFDEFSYFNEPGCRCPPNHVGEYVYKYCFHYREIKDCDFSNETKKTFIDQINEYTKHFDKQRILKKKNRRYQTDIINLIPGISKKAYHHVAGCTHYKGRDDDNNRGDNSDNFYYLLSFQFKKLGDKAEDSSL